MKTLETHLDEKNRLPNQGILTKYDDTERINGIVGTYLKYCLRT